MELRNAGIPIEDLRKFLNSLPGPPLAPTDVTQRLRSVHEEAYNRYPDERLREICLELYNREVSEGAELPAIVGALQELIELEGERLRREAEAAYRERQREEREALQRRFLSGADCKMDAGGRVEGPVYPEERARLPSVADEAQTLGPVPHHAEPEFQ